jgi:hypothetical protein
MLPVKVLSQYLENGMKPEKTSITVVQSKAGTETRES